MAKRLGTKLQKIAAVQITRSAVRTDKIVYVARANKKLKYKYGTASAIAYIGTTKRGADRIAASAVKQARDILGEYGINKLTFYVVTCRAQRNVESWKFLERALIIRFRDLHGEIPVGNDQFKNASRGKEFEYFSDASLDKVIAAYSEAVK
jgi:hypothetical protein